MQLFSSIDGLGTEHLPIRCVGITDADPPDEKTETDGRTKTPINPTPKAKSAGENHALKLIPVFEKSKTTRLYANQLKTFEYDLAMETANTKIMLSVAAECAKRAEKPKIRGELAIRAAKDWGARVDPNVRAAAARYLLEHIDKGEFAQLLASYLSSLEARESFTVPAYIAKAVLWACGISL
jgi:predicted ATP-dependent endonuclease of OLD family